jgi:membrane-associated phospholipid phosphatase
VGGINDGRDNRRICDRRRVYLGILITVLLFFSLSIVPLSHRTNAQPHLNDNKVDYEMIFDNNDGSDDNSSTDQWEQSLSMMTSLNRDFPQTVGRNISNNNPIVSWNQMMTTIGSQKNIPAPYLARDYALMHIAIYDALLQSTNNNAANNKKSSEGAIVAGAAAEVLAYLFPENFASIAALEEQQLTTHIVGDDTSQIVDLRTIGHDVAKKVIAYAETGNDSSDEEWWNLKMPSGPGKWSGTNPIGSSFGYEKTFLLSSGAQFQPPPPYTFGSDKDLADVQAVIDAAHSRTPEQIAIVHKWGDLSPATIWNNMLNDRIESYNLTIFESASAFAYLNAAMYDSFVSCWYTKFTYWTARPYQRISDPAFTTVIQTPNFPSYTSGHSTVSSTAAVILGQLFPEEASYFLSQAHEAAISRLWAGIHFPQDNNNGFAVGQQIGREYVNDMLKPPHQFVVHVR